MIFSLARTGSKCNNKLFGAELECIIKRHHAPQQILPIDTNLWEDQLLFREIN